jgi:uroporphyrinogen-III synthase
MRLLITRPEPDATRTAQALRARGHHVLVAPVLVTQTIETEIGGPHAAVLMTSANAARAGAHPRYGKLHLLPVFAVGDRTAEAARASGFSIVESAGGALPELMQLIAARVGSNSGRLLYLVGEDRSGDLAGDLAGRGIEVDTAVVYRAVAAERLPVELAQPLAAGQLDAALHYSPRSVATLLRLAEQAGALNALLNLEHYCLSDAVAVLLRDARARRISVAARPDETALLGLI